MNSAAPVSPPASRRKWLLLLLVLTALAAVALYYEAPSRVQMALKSALDWLEHLGFWAPVVFVVLYVAFHVFGNWPMAQVLAVAKFNYWYKFAAAIVLTPVLYLAHYAIDRYLGPAETAKLQAEATVDKGV